ncbi:Bacterial type II secretion system protein F domain protein [Maioricimonas rarisocia]|uniref:Bacterial type II secretion system protein F domain protein n=2 Tax=Maioricimonas rarisocia TaxID=2528026 RepID=A0A517ZD37_9PLAN|nr:Bacterial type II secretion system protein F domain protein [Maioricimonas rarisocia]
MTTVPMAINEIVLSPWGASGLMGASVFIVAWTLSRLLASEDLQQDDEWRYDVNRINELRRTSLFYRLLQPLIQALAALNRRAFANDIPEVNRQILAAGHSRYWTGAEWLARIEIIAMMASVPLMYATIAMMGPPGVVLGIVLSVLVGVMLRRRLASQARYRLWQIKLRLPFLLDLLTLLMEAGSTFLLALQEAVHEFRDHPVGEEFGRVLAEMNMGKSRTAALESLRQRLADDEIGSIVGSIIQGEQLGTPLAILFRTQADVLRIKRTQRAETIAGEAAVKMLLPAVLIMAATVLIILGPFVLSFMRGEFLG